MVSHDTFAVNETQPFVADPGHPSFNSAPSCPLVLSGLSEISFRPYVDPTSSVDMESFIVRHHILNSNNGAARSVAVRSTLVREEQRLVLQDDDCSFKSSQHSLQTVQSSPRLESSLVVSSEQPSASVNSHDRSDGTWWKEEGMATGR